MKTAKPVRALTSIILAILLISVNLPFTAMAEVDDFIEEGKLMYLVTSEGSDGAPGTVTAGFNENFDPKTVTEITVPCTVTNDGKSYSVTALSDSAFGSCTALTSLDLSECTKLTSIGMSAFVDCESLNSITIPCNFDKGLFKDTGIVTDGDRFKIEYAVIGMGDDGGAPSSLTETPGGTFTYIHNWEKDSSNSAQHKCSRCNTTEAHDFKVNDKNYSEHICTKCSYKEQHKWQPDANNANQHKCTVCQYGEAHYGGTANCDGKAKCVACSSEYQTASQGGHQWEVMPATIGPVSAEYRCEKCLDTKKEEIGVGESMTAFNGQKLKTILQDPYKVLPEGVELKVKSIEPGSARYNELLANLDDTHKVENVAFFEIELYNAKNEKISGEIAGKVRVLIQIPDGWDKKDLEAVLVMAGADVEFEESVITIDGKDYLAFWTDHFSPYALIETATEKEEKESDSGTSSEGRDTSKTSPATGNSDFVLISALAAVSASAVIFIYLIVERKRKKA